MLGAALGAAILAAHGSGSAVTTRSAWTCPKTAVLTALPTLGTVKWRSRYVSGKAQFSLGLHLFDTVSSEVRFRARKFSRDRSLNPGDRTLWFRYDTSRVQWLAATWVDEAGFVAGVVRADFRTAAVRQVPSGDCWIFGPPHVTVQFYGHHPLFFGGKRGPFPHGGLGGMLRPWPIR